MLSAGSVPPGKMSCQTSAEGLAHPEPREPALELQQPVRSADQVEQECSVSKVACDRLSSDEDSENDDDDDDDDDEDDEDDEDDDSGVADFDEPDIYKEEVPCDPEVMEYLHQLPQYEHKPLTDASKQFRLLRFTQPPRKGIIASSLETFSIAESPRYVAISYVWGAPKKVCGIELSGKYLALTENAHYALWQVARHCEDDAYVWIDGICIDQDDLDEKGQQVRMMGDVYEKASVVYACVGRHYHNSRFLFDILGKVYTSYHMDDSEEKTTVPSLVLKNLRNNWAISGDINSRLSLNTFNREFGDSLKSFTNRKYWKRIWIIQETWLARDLQILCGESKASVDNFTLLWQHGEDLTSGQNEYPKYGSFMQQTLSYSRHLPAEGARNDWGILYSIPSSWKRSKAQPESTAWSMDILTAMSMFREWTCADFRDRVFALQRIVAWPRDMEPLLPNYRITALELLLEVFSRLDPFIDRSGYLLYELNETLNVLGLPSIHEKMQSLLEQHDTTAGLFRYAHSSCGGRICMTWPSDDTPLSICLIQSDANGNMWVDVEDDDDSYPWINISALEKGIEKSHVGAQLSSPYRLIGRVPDSTLPGDLILGLPLSATNSMYRLVLRESKRPSIFNIKGIAVVDPRSTPVTSPLDEYKYRVVLSIKDLLCLWSLESLEIELYALGESSDAIEKCLTTRLASSPESTFVMEVENAEE